MGGSSGGGRRSRGGTTGSGVSAGQSSSDRDPCDLRFRTTLAGVTTQIASGINPNDILKVRVDIRTGTQIAVATLSGGQVVGSINAAETVALIDCIVGGRSYAATVLEVAGAAVTVRIAPS